MARPRRERAQRRSDPTEAVTAREERVVREELDSRRLPQVSGHSVASRDSSGYDSVLGFRRRKPRLSVYDAAGYGGINGLLSRRSWVRTPTPSVAEVVEGAWLRRTKATRAENKKTR